MNILVNAEKAERAAYIVALLTGKARAKDSSEAQRVEHYTRVCEDKGIDVKNAAAATEAVYIALGGLVRTEAEQKVAEAKKEEMKKEGKKNQMGLKKDR